MVNTGRGANTTHSTRLLSGTLAIGLAAGAAISILAFFLARYGPAGDSWSFRGNGALAAYTVIPAILAAGWTALVLRYRTRSDWLSIGAGAGLVGLLLAGFDAALLPIFGAVADAALGGVLLVALAAWAVASPALAATIVRSGPAPRLSGGITITAAVLWLAGTAAGLLLLGIILPAGS